jgi:hypothetical protein
MPPVKGVVSTEKTDLAAFLYSIDGRVVRRVRLRSGHGLPELSAMANARPGVYVITIRSANGVIHTAKTLLVR